MISRDDVIKYLIDKELIDKLSTTFQSQLGVNKADWVQEMWLIILELPEDKLVRLYENKELDWYIISIARNQVTNDKSKFNRLYNDKRITYIYEYPIEEQDED